MSAGVLAAPALAALHATPVSAAHRHRQADDSQFPSTLALANIEVDGRWHLAARVAGGVLDITSAASAFGRELPYSTDALFQHGGGSAVERLVPRVMASGRLADFVYAPEQVKFGAAVLAPEKIVCVGLNYRKHAQEVGAKVPETPILFNKFNNALLGHGAHLHLPVAVAKAFDHEVELVIVIGKTARAVTEDAALDYVAGYCTGNDMSARDLQRRSSQFMLGKSCDGFAPLGPWLVGRALVPNPNALTISCDVNGERRQNSNTADMVFNCAQLVSYVSQHMTLRPGDIIFTGTPEGVIAGKPADKQVWLRPGDVVSCELEGLGELRFTLA
jgi:2-keto-4-pentenoate hydratase/2-oxohepta-3-ene-1,7-dioic acid hydratase in catechol pathway